MLNHTEAQLDFILEMHARDNPEEYEFQRMGETKRLPEPEILAQWEGVLIGKARGEKLAKYMPSEAVLKKAAEMGSNAAALKAFGSRVPKGQAIPVPRKGK